MSSTDVIASTAASTASGTVDCRLEVVVIPVSDVTRARDFYVGLGWRLDAEYQAPDGFHVVQVTPPGSPASVIFGAGVTSAAPGSGERPVLVVDDVEAARAALAGRGAEVSEVFHDAGGVFVHAGTTARVPGADPGGSSYGSWAELRDPDGNGWMLQEITTRLPGRVDPATDVATLARLLHETAEHHDAFEKAAPAHDWWDWYAAYLHAREQGSDSEQATAAADHHMAEVHGVVAHR